VPLLGDVMALRGIRFERHGRGPSVREGAVVLHRPAPGANRRSVQQGGAKANFHNGDPVTGRYEHHRKCHDGTPFTGQRLIFKEVQPHPGIRRLNRKAPSPLPYYAKSL
jgi:hypothetical protein